ncbi:hypothetical protein RchiOBHm_Chr1g0334301 [Rosa chinensis]|uniref:Uncharacterized protein n=1 Tax=Rosa chinensis TaxID=74649 RepID=A0A2P6SCA1_ROSCH|nr:hypothetical protein RchiOBHm_Chr1g0334301 [Rosa chinensis]
MGQPISSIIHFSFNHLISSSSQLLTTTHSFSSETQSFVIGGLLTPRSHL